MIDSNDVAMDVDQWFWEAGKQQLGPVSGIELIHLVMVGAKMTEDTLVWREGMLQWEPFKSIPQLMSPEALPKLTEPSWTAPPGDHSLPDEFQDWLALLDTSATLSLFHTAMTKYMPAIMDGQEAAQTALLTSFIMRQPDMGGDPEAYSLTTSFLATILAECEGMLQQEFFELIVVGNEAHVASLLTSAAQLDEHFMARVRDACHLGQAMKSVDSGDEALLIKQLGEWPALANARNLDGNYILHHVVRANKTPLLRALFAWQSQPECDVVLNLKCLDAENNTPLHLAAAASNVEAAQILLEKGANVNAQNKCEWEYAKGEWRVRLAGGESAVPIMSEHQTALHIAVQQADPETIDVILQHDPDLEIPDSTGMTVLHLGVEEGNTEVVEKLLRSNADLESTNRVFGDGQACLHNASSRGLTEIVRLLLKHGSKGVNEPNAEGWKPLHLAARRGSVETVIHLVEAGADKSAENSQGQTALHLAQINNRSAVVEYLQLEQ